MQSKNQRVAGKQARNEENIFPCHKRFNYGNGAGWCAKRDRKGQRRSSTDGRSKVGCRVTHLDKHMAKAGRSYKHRDYSSWIEKVRKRHTRGENW